MEGKQGEEMRGYGERRAGEEGESKRELVIPWEDQDGGTLGLRGGQGNWGIAEDERACER